MRDRIGAWSAASWIALLTFAALTASWLPIDPNRFDPRARLAAPNWNHPFGTTRLGEDLFAQCVHGSRVTLLVGLGAPLVAALIGLPLGMSAGFLGGRVDQAISLLLDAALSMPTFIVAVVLVTSLGATIGTVIVVVGIISSPFVARVSRSATRAISDRDFVTAARSLGATSGRVIWVELRPNLTAPIGSLLALVGGAAVLVEGGLSYVGLGVPLENASWGRLVASGRDELATAWWWSLLPSLLFFLTILSVNVIGDRWQRGPVHPIHPIHPIHRVRRRATRQIERGSLVTGHLDDAALLVSNLTISLRSPKGGPGREIVSNFDVQLAPGELVALVGPSGVGKTTVARAICGALDDAMVATGSVQTTRSRGHHAALIMQEPRRSLNPVSRVGHQIAEAARVHLGLSRRDAHELARHLLTLVAIDDPDRRMRCYPHELSGGQCQRIAIALALASEPGVLIADEPTASLDPVATRNVYNLFDSVRQRTGVAILVITHDLASARQRADRIIAMS